MLGERNKKMMPRNSAVVCTYATCCDTSSSCMRRVNIRASVDWSVSTFVQMALFRASTRLCNVMGLYVEVFMYLPSSSLEDHFAGWL